MLTAIVKKLNYIYSASYKFPLSIEISYSISYCINNCINNLDLINRIKKLDQRTQEIIYLKITGELTFKEIGEILGISENLARVSFYRGKQKIKEVDKDEKECKL